MRHDLVFGFDRHILFDVAAPMHRALKLGNVLLIWAYAVCYAAIAVAGSTFSVFVFRHISAISTSQRSQARLILHVGSPPRSNHLRRTPRQAAAFDKLRQRHRSQDRQYRGGPIVALRIGILGKHVADVWNATLFDLFEFVRFLADEARVGLS
jgi:hypothetical protein